MKPLSRLGILGLMGAAAVAAFQPLIVMGANKNVWISDPLNTKEGVQNYAACGSETLTFTAQTAWPPGKTWSWSGATLLYDVDDTPSQAQGYYSSSGSPYYVTATYNGETAYAVKVTIIDIVQSDDLCYFTNEEPANYRVAVTLTAPGATTGTFVWSISSGSPYALFTGSHTSLTRTDTNTVGLFSTGGSASFGDVSIAFSWSDLCSCVYYTQVYKPASLSFQGNLDLSDAGYGYESRISYKILDQFGAYLPRAVELNEYWSTSIIDDYFNTTWRRGAAGGTMVNPQGWYDSIQGEAPGYTPAAQNPQTPLGATKVEHWGQRWYVGSLSPGYGTLVHENTLQKYQDHARHE